MSQRAATPAGQRQEGGSSTAGRAVESDLTSVCYAQRDAQDGEIGAETAPTATETWRAGTRVNSGGSIFRFPSEVPATPVTWRLRVSPPPPRRNRAATPLPTAPRPPTHPAL